MLVQVVLATSQSNGIMGVVKFRPHMASKPLNYISM